MVLRIVSDLHLEFRLYYSLPEMDREWEQTLVLAGDICPIGLVPRCIEFFRDVNNRFKYVIFVIGNHEYYHSDFVEGIERLKLMLAHLSNIHVLENEMWNGVAGATLWTNFNKHDINVMRDAYHGMSDFRVIDNIDIEDVYDRHIESYNYLGGCGAQIIVSHHAPSMKSIHSKYKGDRLNGAFASKLQIPKHIKLWVHGHVHHSFDYMQSSTRVLCNPLGYPEEVTGFYPYLTVEV